MLAVKVTITPVKKTVTKTETNHETTTWGGVEMENGLFGRSNSESTRKFETFSHTLIEIKLCDLEHSKRMYQEWYEHWEKGSSALRSLGNFPSLPKKLKNLRVGELLTTNESSLKTSFEYEEKLLSDTYYIPIHTGMGGWYFKRKKALSFSSTFQIEGEFNKRGVSFDEVLIETIPEDLMCLIEDHLEEVNFFDGRSFDNRYSVDKAKREMPKPKKGESNSYRHKNKSAGHNPFKGLADLL